MYIGNLEFGIYYKIHLIKKNVDCTGEELEASGHSHPLLFVPVHMGPGEKRN